jgi:hypothetical protein
MLGFAPLGQFPLGQPAAVPAIITLGSGISGGTFSKGRWRRLKEEERARALAIVRARERQELRRRAAARKAAATRRAEIDADRAAEDRANAERARRQGVIDALAALTGARTVGETFAGGAAMATLAAEAQRAKAAEQDEEEAIVRLLLLDV